MSHASLSGRVALVTGAATGIGQASAAVFAERGAKLVLADIDIDGGEAVFVRADAGIDGRMALTHELTEDEWDRVIAVNLRGVFLCMKYELRQMLAQGGGGAIVNVSSVAGLQGYATLSPYAAAKHGVLGLTKSTALAYAKRGIRINALCPGAVRTPMIDDALRQGLMSEAQMIAMEPIGRIGEPREIADAAAWMCSDEASFMLGHAMVVDGGIMAG